MGVTIGHSLYLRAPRSLAWVSEPLEPLGPGHVLVKTQATAISIGTELPMYTGAALGSTPRYPHIMGYESYGEVIAVAKVGVHRLRVGDRVLGFYGQRDYAVCAQDSLVQVPSDLDPAFALLAILSCDAAKGVHKLALQGHEKVLVSGLGTMGLLTVHYLRMKLGLTTIHAIEPDGGRASLGIQLGASRCFSVRPPMDETYHAGIECSARNAAFATLQAAMTSGGRICVLSDGNVEPLVLYPAFYDQELTIVGSSDGYDYQAHAQWFFATARRTPIVRSLFEKQVSVAELIPAFADLADRRMQPVKVMVSYDSPLFQD